MLYLEKLRIYRILTSVFLCKGIDCMDSKKSERIGYIDGLKGATILLVVFGHVAEKYLKFNVYNDYEQMYRCIYNLFYSFHMQLFMIVSGYLYSKAFFDKRGILVKKRIVRHWSNTFIIYIVVSILVWASKMIFSKDILHPVSTIDIWLIIIKPIGHLWYLHLLLFFYICNVSVVRLCSTDRRISTILLILVFLSIISSVCMQDSMLFLFRALKYELFFYLGIIVDRREKYFIFSQGMVIFGGALAAICAICADFLNKDNTDLSFGISTIIAYGVSMAIFYGFKEHYHVKTFLNDLGQNCLEIYLFHQFIVTILQKILPALGVGNGLVSFLLNGTISVAVIWVFVIICKKIGVWETLFKPINLISKDVYQSP